MSFSKMSNLCLTITLGFEGNFRSIFILAVLLGIGGAVELAPGYLKLVYDYLQGIENGLPLGAMVTTSEIASVLAQKIQFNTFGGNPVCSAGGLAVLRVLDKEKRQKHCADIGSHLIGRLKDLQQRYESNRPIIDILHCLFPPQTYQFNSCSYWFLKSEIPLDKYTEGGKLPTAKDAQAIADDVFSLFVHQRVFVNLAVRARPGSDF